MTFDSVSFIDVDMTELVDQGSTFTGCVFRGVRFNASVHNNAAFLNCTFVRCSFFDARFVGCKLLTNEVRSIQVLLTYLLSLVSERHSLEVTKDS